jgi:hypothetical protein
MRSHATTPRQHPGLARGGGVFFWGGGLLGYVLFICRRNGLLPTHMTSGCNLTFRHIMTFGTVTRLCWSPTCTAAFLVRRQSILAAAVPACCVCTAFVSPSSVQLRHMVVCISPRDPWSASVVHAQAAPRFTPMCSLIPCAHSVCERNRLTHAAGVWPACRSLMRTQAEQHVRSRQICTPHRTAHARNHQQHARLTRLPCAVCFFALLCTSYWRS